MDNKQNHKKPHLLIYAHYYDLASTAQIVRELAEGMINDFKVTVICVVPSYLGVIDEKWKKRKYYFETINGVSIIRVKVPEFSKANRISRIKNILTYFMRAMIATHKVDEIDFVMSVSQPPILGGLLGVWGKRTKKNRKKRYPKLIYQIQDFNPEQVQAVSYIKNKIILQIMMTLDKFTCSQSDLVITVGRDLVDTIHSRFRKKPAAEPKSVIINNWIDEKEIYPLSSDNKNVQNFKKNYNLDGKFVFMYSGNIGLYYDLENLIKVIRRFPPGTLTESGKEVVFVFVGAGSVLESLKNYRYKHKMTNVTFIPYQSKEELIYSLNAGDVHWCVNAKGIKGVSCPSKYYGLAAAGKPILGVLEKDTEIRCLIEETGGGLVSDPGDYEAVSKNIQWYIENDNEEILKKIGRKSNRNLLENLTKSISINKYIREITNLVK